MKRILITGGLGYLGGRVATYLKEKKKDLNIFLTTRNLNKKLPPWSNQFSVLQMDLLSYSSIINCLNKMKIDIIIHLASLNEIDSIKDPDLALEVNTGGTLRLLRQASFKNIKHFVYLSSFHVYGKPTTNTITEETPTKPFHPYAITHKAAEDFVTSSKHYHGLNSLILRLSNGYGYPMDRGINRWTLVVNDFCRQAVTTGKIILKSSGKQHRDFITLYDVARAIYHFIFTIPDKWGDGLYNLGGNCNISIIEMAKKISKIYHHKYKERKGEIEIIKPNEDSKNININELSPFTFNIDKLKKSGFHLNGNMEKEISKTMEICEGFLNA